MSQKRIIVLAAGIQSGKTTFGALWIGNRAAQIPPTHNLIIAAPTYKILAQATLPKFLQVYGAFGTYNKVESTFKFQNGVTVYIRSLTDPNSMEGITDVEGIWLDEGGLISRYAWENVEGRSAFRQAPIVISTTPYALNWLYFMWEDWKKGMRDDVDFIHFTSRQNPFFPDAEFERQRRLLDPRRFNMKYMGQFGKMEGLVYESINTCTSHKLPTGTKYVGGIDWGYTNPFVISVRAVTPDGIHYRVAEFYKSGLMIEEIVSICIQRMHIYGIEYFIGDPSAPANIEALNRGGAPCIPGNNNVRAGIDAHSLLIKEERFFIFKDDNPMGLDEYGTYHYPEPKEHAIDEDRKEPEPVKAFDHGCDADRYVTMHFATATQVHRAKDAGLNKRPEDIIQRKKWLMQGGSARFGNG